MTDTSEVERLRARVAELEAEHATRPGATRTSTHRRSGWWAAASAVLIVVACVLAPLSVASVWASSVLSNTDRYVETVAPMADDPAVQDALAAKVTSAVFENLDLEGDHDRRPPTIADAAGHAAAGRRAAADAGRPAHRRGRELHPRPGGPLLRQRRVRHAVGRGEPESRTRRWSSCWRATRAAP